ncbi:MAG: bifunctional methionine sulfoxide reductase B/A protein [Spirochaetales bacterium]|nr:bifunctional methionine sulfoxide reductase B/A protein [Spirochaetales bacterium]
MEDNNNENLELLNSRLEPFEISVIEYKATERPFSGEYYNNTASGTYVCRRCGEPLYHSDDKFNSGCGWPSFDDEIEGAVRRETDADGHRTEILCSSCGGHLGHVFIGEHYTEKNTRHCVNSISMRFVPDEGETGRAVFAGGCFWGVEYLFKELDGVTSTTVGYTGGQTSFPTYKEVCYTDTGHIEAIEVIYDPEKITFRELAKYFFEIHDPTQQNGQGPDIGKQYLSAIFYENEEQHKIATELITVLESKGLDIATSLRSAGAFWPAEEYHQDYYSKTGKTPYCHAYIKRFDD